MKGILIFLLVLCVLMGCVEQTESKDHCSSDSDCICGGIDTKTGECFIGNKEYYDRYVDKNQSCPDFCYGIAGHLEVKCMDNICTQVQR